MRDQFTNDGVFRIAENAVRLLVAVDAKTHALVAEDMMRRIGRRIYGNYAGDTQRQLKALEQDLESAKPEAGIHGNGVGFNSEEATHR